MGKFLEGDVKVGCTEDMKEIIRRMCVEDILTAGKYRVLMAFGLDPRTFIHCSFKMAALTGVTAKEIVDIAMLYPGLKKEAEEVAQEKGCTVDEALSKLEEDVQSGLTWAKESLIRHPNVWREPDEYPKEKADLEGIVDPDKDGGPEVPKRGNLNG
jgi:hypothetical protein